jgi:hypothetical protein
MEIQDLPGDGDLFLVTLPCFATLINSQGWRRELKPVPFAKANFLRELFPWFKAGQ